jgi:tyrosyl-tRNA synthetase
VPVKITVFEGLNSFEINRDDKWGGPIQFQSIELLISVFGENNLSPQDLKLGIADWIVNLLEPIRDHFESDEMKELVYQAYPNK